MAINQGLFFDAGANPFAVSPFEEEDIMEAFARQEQPFQPQIQQQAQQMIAPNTPPPGVGMAMQPGTAPPGLPPQPPNISQPAPQPGSFLNSPGMAMAAQGVNNISALRRGRVPQTTPVQAYQQAVNRQAILKQRDKEMELRKKQEARAQSAEGRAAETHERGKNPLADFQAFVQERGIEELPYEQQLKEFKDFKTSTAASGRITKSWTGANGNMWFLDAAGNPHDTGVGGSPGGTEVVDVGGVPYVQIKQPGGEKTTVPLSEYQKQYRTQSLSDEAGATQTGKTQAEVRTKALETSNAEIRNAIGAPYDEAMQMLENTRDLRAQIESGQFQKTGVFEGPMAKMMGDPEAARLQAKSIGQALKNLQITNLAPVTEREIDMIQDLYAGIGADPAQNVQILMEAEKLLQQKLDQIDKVASYYANNNDSLEGYGMDRYRKAPPASAAGEDTVINLVLRDGKLVPE